ncbi:hypothetical protein THAOC_15527 [Thalassiosira oceanica]|uniref:Uncharacterized protein n=1 Tax=Thalassiosira oceanica TaxID=159749 RepID=K0SCI3_THAOC|nr:hypothetical protein THAOC_15527 [Thalassiosira oceanica]|mmetsp:Transcript_20444/g.46200  ORF Transcript_20444/g.46200 Transcript_20444/m.46200 type:complete len:470 (+) Transcript_20444:109-1518(+)|eukprot:EJK63798.1 hypothetical protein THAOC_15527 [Thalassiosira oceanica]
MSGFSSLLENFKHTTELAAAAASSSSNVSSSASEAHKSRKRPHAEISDTHIFPTTPVARIYIACPANVETGGPEALHQLCHVINAGEYSYLDDEVSGRGASNRDEFGRSKQDPKRRRPIKAYMLYLRERGSSVEHVDASAARSPKYEKYHAPPAEELPGAAHDGSGSSLEYSSDLVIWPEVWTHLIDSLQCNEADGGKYQSAIWWLSVNNNKGRFTSRQFESRKDVLHLVQSAYARYYVRSKLGGSSYFLPNESSPSKYNAAAGRQPTNRVLMMTEFLPDASPSFSSSAEDKGDDSDVRDIDVVYNTAKGMHYTDEIIRRACGKKTKPELDGSIRGGGLRFSPIGKGEGGRERLSGEEVVALLRRAKVYVDFGPHPGMDRLPREAALAGCVVLTNREGAAAFDEDVPLPKELKFSSFEVEKIYSAIKDVCANLKRESAKLERYREWILGQEQRMKICVDRFIEMVATNR